MTVTFVIHKGDIGNEEGRLLGSRKEERHRVARKKG